MNAAALTITRPDDWHLHVRDGELMRSVIGSTASVFGRAVIMPNLQPPITTVAAAWAYRERIAAALPNVPQNGTAPSRPTNRTAPSACGQSRIRGKRYRRGVEVLRC